MPSGFFCFLPAAWTLSRKPEGPFLTLSNSQLNLRMSPHATKRRKLSSSPEVDQPPNLTSQRSQGLPVNTDLKYTTASGDLPTKDLLRSKPSTNGAIVKRGDGYRSAELASATGLYKSSFFKLQMDELLADSRPNYDSQGSRIRDTLHKLKAAIERFPERLPKLAVDAEKELRTEHDIVVPFPEPRPGKDTKYLLSYAKPVNINVVGSFALRTGTRTAEPYVTDLAVTMPSSIFQEKDYVNYRYFHKRAYYIACIAAAIRETKDLDLRLKFEMHDGDSLRPVITLEPVNSGEDKSARSRSRIRIITAIEDTVFPLSKTLPTRNNIRDGSSEDKSQPSAEKSTTFYNSALRSEATVALYHKYVYSAAQKCDSFRDACILGRIWLRQRGFRSSFQGGGFGGFEWAALLSLLFEGGGPNGKPILSKSYSSYQLFKATLQFIAGRNLIQPLQLFATGISFPQGGPVLYDGKRGLNILYKMTPWSYALLRHETVITLKMLNDSRHDNFERVFIVKVSEPMLRFDRLVSLPFLYNGEVSEAVRCQSAIYDVLSRALGNRVKLIFLSSCGAGAWSVHAKRSPKKTVQTLFVGLLLDPENSTRVVDHGPSAEERDEAASFRSFWGDKAELRRFKDGSILESLVWSDLPSAPSIIYQILVYILRCHFAITESDIRYIGDAYDERLRSVGDNILSYSDPSFQTITSAFTSLERSIQTMDDVPLTVRQLSPASPLFRYTSLQVHAASKPVDLVLQFESSGRWPDDLAAIQMTKVAFLIKIGDSLESSGVASLCRVGLENESSKILNSAFLDIAHVSGITFRLRIHHDREQTLLERQLKEKGIGSQTREQIAYALFAYKRLFVQAPRLTQAIRTLCTRFPLLSPTVRLVKHWFNAHLFAAHINEELIELLTTRTFTQPQPWDTPSSVMAGFLRTIHFLSRWDWQQEPLIADLGGELNQQDIEAINTRFAAWRSIDPAMNNITLFAASDIDHDGVTWTQYEMPPKVVAARISTLAKATIKLLREKGDSLDVHDLFHTSLAPYDFVINLRPKLLVDRPLPSKFKNLDNHTTGRASKSTALRYFVRDLQACYNQSILLFHGGEHCSVIAGLWNPQNMKPRELNLKMAYSTSPASPTDSRETQKDVVKVNCSAILNEISRLGGTMVESIEVHRTDTSEG